MYQWAAAQPAARVHNQRPRRRSVFLSNTVHRADDEIQERREERKEPPEWETAKTLEASQFLGLKIYNGHVLMTHRNTGMPGRRSSPKSSAQPPGVKPRRT